MYTYDTVWRDKLIAYDGQTITYDAQGNPLSYRGHTLTWEKGRQLKSFRKMENGVVKDTISYTYNANGIRTSKTVNGVKHEYLLDGVKILRETWKTNGIVHTLIPLYDNEDAVCGIVYNNTPYYFLKNQQGDVISITDSAGKVVANYTYDAWGKPINITGTALSIASINPFRYRGYYYDSETGMYYLQSRYYDPVVGRFVNADDALFWGLSGNITAFNSFAYCENRIIDVSDPYGYSIAAASILAIIFQAVYTAIVYTLILLAAIAVILIIIKGIQNINRYIKSTKNKKLAASLATLAAFTTAATPPPPNDPKFKGTKTKGSRKLYEKGKVRVEIENMGDDLGDIHLQIKDDENKYYYNVKDMKFYLNRSHTKLAPKAIQNYLNDQKIVDAIIKGLTKYLGY